MSTYTLIGMPGSLYTGKPRSYLRKQGIDFVEHPMGTKRFREEIVPRIGRFIVPVLLTPEDGIVQDGTAIIDYFAPLKTYMDAELAKKNVKVGW